MITDKRLVVNGVTLAYKEVNESSKDTLVFVHGNSGSSNMWMPQLQDESFSKHRLIAFDLPAHGASAALADTENYNVIYFAELLAHALEKLGVSNYVIIGFSLGTNICAEMLSFHVRPNGLVLIGPTVIGEEITLHHTGADGADLSVLFTDRNEMATAGAFFSQLTTGEMMQEQLINDYFLVKDQFRSSLLRSAMNGKFTNEIGAIKEANLPVLVIFGGDDKVFNPHYLDNAGLQLWQNRIFKVDGAYHFVNLDDPEMINNLLCQYAGNQL